MDPFIIKILSASLLWIISVCFGVVLPYFLWKISPDQPGQRSGDSDNENEDRTNELENLIINRQSGSDRRHGVPGAWKRFASWMRVKFTNGSISSLVNCLCGGVFLGVSLLDLVPQSRAAVTAVLEQTKTVTNYPVAEFMVSLGLLMVMIIENLVTELVLSDKSGAESDRTRRSRSTSSQHHTAGTVVEEREHAGHSRSELEVNVSSYRMYVLVITLSLHSVFEGLAIGLQEELSTLVQLVVAISVHKAVLSFGIGLPLFETLGRVGKTYTAIFCSLIFCTASPLGCFVGAFVSSDKFNSSPGAMIASAVLQCLATGTFLYVTFVEVIPREFSHHSKQHTKRTKHPPAETSSLSIDGDSSDSAHGSDQNSASVEVTTTDSRRAFSKNAKQKTQSQIVKLLALLFGFAIASGLQFL